MKVSRLAPRDAPGGGGPDTALEGSGRSGVAVVPRWIVEDKGISGAAKLVYLTLSSRINRENVAWPSHRLMAAETGTSVSTVQRALVELRDLGVLTWRPRRRGDNGQTSNEYVLALSPWDAARRASSQGTDRGAGQSDRGPSVKGTDERTQDERPSGNDASGLLAGPPPAAERGVPPTTTKRVVARFVREGLSHGIGEADVRALAGLVGLCVKAASEHGASGSAIQAALGEVLAEAASLDSAPSADDVLSAFEVLGVERHSLGGGRP